MFRILQSFYSASVRGCLNYPCLEHRAKLSHFRHERALRKKKKKQKREKRQLWEAWKSSHFICSTYLPFSAFTYIFFLYLLFNILSKSGTEVACKSFLLSTCSTEHSATQVPKIKQQDEVTEGSDSSVAQQAITVATVCQEWRHKAMQETITIIIKSVFWCFPCEPSAIIYSTTLIIRIFSLGTALTV